MASLAEELLQVLTKHPYEPLLRWIHTEHKYVKSEVLKLQDKYTGKYSVDTTRCINKHGRTITNGLFDIFGKFSKKNAADTRKAMIDWIKTNLPEVKRYTSIAFKRAYMTVEDWLVTMTLNSVPGDELAIYCLSKMYLRHVVVYTKKYYWTTVAHDWADTEEIVGRKCELELIYMGPGRFGELIPIINPANQTTPPPGTRTSNRPKYRLNYAAMNTGTEENKKEKKTPPRKRKRESPLPKKEPSAKRIKSQKMLTRQGVNELASPNHTGRLIGTVVVTSPSSSDSTQPETEIKTEIKIKTEEDILRLPPNVPRKVVDLRDPTVPLVIRHTDGSLCHSKKSYAFYNKTPPPRHDELPDLPDIEPASNTVTPPAATDTLNTKELELRDLLDLPTPNEADSVGNTESETLCANKPHASAVDTEKNVHRSRSNNTGDETAEIPKTSQEHQPKTTSLNDTSNSQLTTTAIHPNTGTLSVNNDEADDQRDLNADKPTPNQESTEKTPSINDDSNGANTTNEISNQDSTAKTPSINDDSNGANTTNEISLNTDTPSINNDADDQRDLTDAGLKLTKEKPIEKAYNEWLTTFSDDSLFDEMTEDLNKNETHNSAEKSPEQRAAEGLLLLSNHTETNERLMPIDAPKLPDLVQEMDAEQHITDLKNTTDIEHESKRTKSTLTLTGEPVNTENNLACNKENSKENAVKTKSPTKGVFQMRTIGLRKHKSPTHLSTRKIGCSMCKQTFNSRNKLKTHHTQDHNILNCDICGKSFSTKKSLSKHLYKHSDLPWKCKKCGEGFAFPSELRAHLVKHETEPMFKCNIIGCNREYMRQSELNAHMKTHDGTVHKCPEKDCTYEAIDIRYLKNHMKVHTDDLPYPCKECDEAFKHFMQRKRHYKNVHS